MKIIITMFLSIILCGCGATNLRVINREGYVKIINLQEKDIKDLYIEDGKICSIEWISDKKDNKVISKMITHCVNDLEEVKTNSKNKNNISNNIK